MPFCLDMFLVLCRLMSQPLENVTFSFLSLLFRRQIHCSSVGEENFDQFQSFLREYLLPVPNPHSGELTLGTSPVKISPLLLYRNLQTICYDCHSNSNIHCHCGLTLVTDFIILRMLCADFLFSLQCLVSHALVINLL